MCIIIHERCTLLYIPNHFPTLPHQTHYPTIIVHFLDHLNPSASMSKLLFFKSFFDTPIFSPHHIDSFHSTYRWFWFIFKYRFWSAMRFNVRQAIRWVLRIGFVGQFTYMSNIQIKKKHTTEIVNEMFDLCTPCTYLLNWHSECQTNADWSILLRMLNFSMA